MSICSYNDDIGVRMMIEENEMKHLLDEETLFLVSQTFKALSDSTRIRILFLLSKKECSVSEIVDILDLSQSNVSHQLRFLKNLRLVKFRREKTSIYYSIDDEHVIRFLHEAIDHAKHD